MCVCEGGGDRGELLELELFVQVKKFRDIPSKIKSKQDTHIPRVFYVLRPDESFEFGI